MPDMHQRIKSKEEFALESPVLQLGEHGLEKDTGLFKIGDGVTRWNSLDYSNESGGTAWGNISGKPTVFKPDVTDEDFLEALSGVSVDTSNLMVVVSHGADANVARPVGALVVYWLGTVEPLNALDDDLWSGDVDVP